MWMGEAVPTMGMGSKWDGGMLGRPFEEQMVVKFIVGWAGLEWGAPISRWDSRPIPMPISFTMGIP